MKVIILRYFNPIGTHNSGLIGKVENKKESTGLIENLIKSYNTNSIFNIYGNNYIESNDGTPMRDFIDVCDLASVHRILLNEIKNKDDTYYIYNIGTGFPISVNECVKCFNKVFNTNLNIVFKDRREGDSPLSFGNTELITENTSWKPLVTLEESLYNIKVRNNNNNNIYNG